MAEQPGYRTVLPLEEFSNATFPDRTPLAERTHREVTLDIPDDRKWHLDWYRCYGMSTVHDDARNFAEALEEDRASILGITKPWPPAEELEYRIELHDILTQTTRGVERAQDAVLADPNDQGLLELLRTTEQGNGIRQQWTDAWRKGLRELIVILTTEERVRSGAARPAPHPQGLQYERLQERQRWMGKALHRPDWKPIPVVKTVQEVIDMIIRKQTLPHSEGGAGRTLAQLWQATAPNSVYNLAVRWADILGCTFQVGDHEIQGQRTPASADVQFTREQVLQWER